MDILKKIRKEINRGVATITVKASTALEKNELNTYKNNLEEKVQKLKASVGDLLYDMWVDEAIDFEKIQPMLEEIEAHHAEINETQAKIDKIDEESRNILGVEEDKTPEVPAVEGLYSCENCGAQYQNPFKFCRKCGKPYQE